MNDKDSEEFNNFLHKVNHVTGIIKNLNSKDPYLEKVGQMEADSFLNIDSARKILNDMDEDEVKTEVKYDRSLINTRDLSKAQHSEGGVMSQEAFMAEASRDAERRYLDRLVRMEKMETHKKRATSAFRQGDYEKALCFYNKAIEQIKDSPLLYNNRCLTYINLKLFKKAVNDAETALKLSENCLRSFLLLSKAHFLNGDMDKFNEIISKAKSIHEDYTDFITGFVCGLENNRSNKKYY